MTRQQQTSHLPSASKLPAPEAAPCINKQQHSKKLKPSNGLLKTRRLLLVLALLLPLLLPLLLLLLLLPPLLLLLLLPLPLLLLLLLLLLGVLMRCLGTPRQLAL
jgi:hypothetical protein